MKRFELSKRKFHRNRERRKDLARNFANIRYETRYSSTLFLFSRARDHRGSRVVIRNENEAGFKTAYYDREELLAIHHRARYFHSRRKGERFIKLSTRHFDVPVRRRVKGRMKRVRRWSTVRFLERNCG